MIHLNNVDWHATDRCNLRCVSCGHMCSLVDHLHEEFDRTVEQANEDFKILYKVTNNGEYLDGLMITGGECTLNKYLPEILDVAYQYFPNKIKIWSNCINLSLYTEELIERLIKYNIQVNFTLYIVERKNIIEQFFQSHHINYNIYMKKFSDNNDNQTEFFDKFFTIDEIPNNKDYNWCDSKFNCCQLVNKKLYICQYMAFLPYLFEYYKDQDYSKLIEYTNSSKYIDLEKVQDYKEIEEYITNYNEPICQHCIDKWMISDDYDNKIKYRIQKWRPSKKNISEWIINNIEEIYKKT